MAAVLYAGPRSEITGPAALRRWRVGARDNGIVDVLVPRDRRTVSRDFVRVHRTARMPKLVAANGEIQLVLVARAVIDAGLAIRNRRELRALIAGVVQRGHYTPTELTAELEQSRARNASLMRSVLAEVAQGIRSASEGDLMDLIKRAGLPTPLYNHPLYVGNEFLATPDAWWPHAGVAVEVDSASFTSQSQTGRRPWRGTHAWPRLVSEYCTSARRRSALNQIWWHARSSRRWRLPSWHPDCELASQHAELIAFVGQLGRRRR